MRATVAAGNGLCIDSFTVLGSQIGNARRFLFKVDQGRADGATNKPSAYIGATIVWMKNGSVVNASAEMVAGLIAPNFTAGGSPRYTLSVFAGQTTNKILLQDLERAGSIYELSEVKSGDQTDGNFHAVVQDVRASASTPLVATRSEDAGSTAAQTVTVAVATYLDA